MKILEAQCSEVKIGDRHRKDMGDLHSLADSIEHIGLLQPIGITEDYELVFGERRLRAVKELLRLPTISARVVKVPSILQGEYHENEIRKDFTVSERVAIAAALRDEIKAKTGERRGGNHESKDQKIEQCQELDGKRTAEVVAERAGFGNPETFRQAEKVVLKGHADLVRAMDEGHVSISAASKLAELPKSEQRKAVAGGRSAVKEAIKADAPPFNLDVVLEHLRSTVRNIVNRIPQKYKSEAVDELRELAREVELCLKK